MSEAEGVVMIRCDRADDIPVAAESSEKAGANRGALRVAIVSELCSLTMGGEAAIPFVYFRLLRARGVDAHLVAHARNALELLGAFPNESERIHLVSDSALHRCLWAMGRILPDEVRRATTGFASRLYTQVHQRRILRRLVRDGAVSVIHQPTPVSPAVPSLIHGCGAPILMGPMNGDMEYPPAFRHRGRMTDRLFVRVARWGARWANYIVPGKRHAWLLLAANARTEAALGSYHPDHAPARLVENGVDLSFWLPPEAARAFAPGQPVRFVFSGRLVSWKGVDLLLAAWGRLPTGLSAELLIIGDGPERRRLEAQHRRIGLGERVRFAGWLGRAEVAREMARADVLVHPSLLECGGSSVLEAMACELPVIACDWGGPADYLDPTCGVLIPPTYPQQLIDALMTAIVTLAESEPLRLRLGRAGREKVIHKYGWNAKIDRVIEFYEAAIKATPGPMAEEG